MGHFESQVRQLLRDDAFMRFMQEEPYVYRECDAGGNPPTPGLPAGVSPELARELVLFARRMRATPPLAESEKDASPDRGEAGAPTSRADDGRGGPAAGGAGREFWVISPDMYRDLFDVVARASATSALWERMRQYESRDELRLLIASDLHAAARRDGLTLGNHELRELALSRRPAATPQEALAANALELLADASVLEGACDEQALREVWGRLVRGCDGLDDHPRTRITVDEMLPCPRGFTSTVGSVATRMERAGHCETHPLMDLIFVCDIMFDDGPFERFNAMMEVVLRHAFLRRLGMPVLAYAPYSAIRLDWEMGVSPQLYGRPYGKAFELGPYGTDSTLCLRESIAFMRRGLEQVKQVVAEMRSSDERLCAQIEADWRLNDRQKSALCELVNDPRHALDAAGYSARFGVVSSTAHADLAALVRLGLVRIELEGRRRVYRPAPR